MKNLDTSIHAGIIRCKHSVSSDGHGICSIPISVPPGTNKMQPKLSLMYASDHENDLLGIGWRLTGLSKITRVGQTLAQDKDWTAINYTDSDRFALDGQRIVALTLQTIGENTVYKTEIDSWLRIVPHFETGIDGPSGFTVTSKQGKKMEYGLDTESTSRIMAVGKSVVRTWLLNSVEDLYGNYMTISYINDKVSGSYVPNKIDYTGNNNKEIPITRSVLFGFEDRLDSIIRYQGGSRIKQIKRLKTISTFLDGELVLTYNLDYKYAKLSGFSQLNNITLSDGKGVPLPQTTLIWAEDNEQLFDSAVAHTPPGIIPYQPVQSFSMDVNGNGLNDMVLVWSDQDNFLNYAILFSNHDGLGDSYVSKPTKLLYYDYSLGLSPADINGDGRSDLVYFFLDQNSKLNYAKFIFDGEKFDVSNPIITSLVLDQSPRVIPMDVTGDGSSDIVIPVGNIGMLEFKILLSNGSEYEPQQPSPPTKFPIMVPINSINILPIKITGSPRQDLIYSYWENSKMNLVSFISNGKGFEPATPFSYSLDNTGESTTRILPVNLNGDGLSDIALSRQSGGGLILDLFVSDGTRICQPEPALLSFSIPNAEGYLIPMDMTGDGRIDLLHTYPNYPDNVTEMVAYLCKGGIFEASPNSLKSIPSATGSINSMSFDGSGKTGLLYLNNPTSNNAPVVNWDLKLIKASDGYPGVVTAFKNGIGGQIIFNYESLATPGIYSESLLKHTHAPFGASNEVSGLSHLSNFNGMSVYVGAGSSGQPTSSGSIKSKRLLRAPIYVVTSFEKSDGRGNTYKKTYTYQGARISLTGRNWLGFEKRFITDSDNNKKSIESFYQKFPFVSRSKKIAKYRLSDLSLLSTTKYGYLDQNVPSSRIHTALKLKETVDHFTFAENAANPDFTYINEFTYDDYGNVTLKSNLSHYSGGTCNAVYTNFKYYYDKLAHVNSYVKEKKTCSDEELTDVLSLINYDRYPNTMGIKTKILWIKKTNESLEESKTYDDFGNVNSITNYSKDTKTFVFDKSTNYTYPTTIKYPPDNNNVVLEKHIGYDLRFGIKTSYSDVNGFKRFNKLDDLGRVIEKHGPNPDGADFLLAQISRMKNSVSGYCVISKTALDWTSKSVIIKMKYYDGLNRVFQSEIYGQTGSQVSNTILTTTKFDGLNRALQKSLPFFEGQDPVNTLKSYSPYGNVKSIQQPINLTQRLSIDYTHDSNTKISKHSIGLGNYKTLKTTRERFGTKLKIVSFVDGDSETTNLQYDALGRIKKLLMPNKDEENFEYDTANRKIQMNADSFGQFKYIHNKIKRQFTLEDAESKTNKFSYDKLGRLLTLSYEPDVTITLGYDDPSSDHGNLKLCTIQMEQSEKTIYKMKFDYFPSGGKSKEWLSIDSLEFTTLYTYTSINQIETITAPNGSVIKYEYTNIGLVDNIAFKANTADSWTTYAEYKNYTALGKPQLVIYPISGISNKYEYNNIGLINCHRVENNVESLLVDTFGFDDLTRISSKARDDASFNYKYDNAGRLKSVTNESIGERKYSYDSGGNISTNGDNTFNYKSHQIKMTNSVNGVVTTYDFDENGNLSTREQDGKVFKFSFNGFGKLATVSSNQKPLRTYYYNDKGARLKTIDHTKNETSYQVHPWFKTIKDKNGLITHELQMGGPTGMIANILSSPSSQGNNVINDRKFIHLDNTNSIILTTDDTGKVATKISYLPFGNISEISGPNSILKKFGGKEWDPEIGLYDFDARFYDPNLSRFISPDTQLTSKNLRHDVFNRYAFVLNDPINFQDPTGHGILSWILLILGAVVGVALGIVLPGAGEVIDAGLAAGVEAGEGLVDAGIESSEEGILDESIEDEAVPRDELPEENAEAPHYNADAFGDFAQLPREIFEMIGQNIEAPEDLANFAQSSRSIQDTIMELHPAGRDLYSYLEDASSYPETYDSLDNASASRLISRYTNLSSDEALNILDEFRQPGWKLRNFINSYWD